MSKRDGRTSIGPGQATYVGSNAGEAHPHIDYNEGPFAGQRFPKGDAPGSPPKKKKRKRLVIERSLVHGDLHKAKGTPRGGKYVKRTWNPKKNKGKGGWDYDYKHEGEHHKKKRAKRKPKAAPEGQLGLFDAKPEPEPEAAPATEEYARRSSRELASYYLDAGWAPEAIMQRLADADIEADPVQGARIVAEAVAERRKAADAAAAATEARAAALVAEGAARIAEHGKPEVTLTKLGPQQQGALEIYIFDPAHDEAFPGWMAGGALQVTNVDQAHALLTDAANSADDDVQRLTGTDRKLARLHRSALEELGARILRERQKNEATIEAEVKRMEEARYRQVEGPGLTEHQQRRKERAEAKAARLRAQGEQQWERSSETVRHIPMGQPILVDHHSAKRHRRAVETAQRRSSQAVATLKEADRAESAARSAGRSISSDDPEAVQALTAKLERLEAQRDRMKAANKVWGKAYKAAMKAQGVSPKAATDEQHDVGFAAGGQALIGAGWPAEVVHRLIASKQRAYWQSPGKVHATYELTNLGANLRTAKKRIESLRQQAATPAKPDIAGKGWRIAEDKDDNRIRFHFDEKPDRETITKMKRAGFRWSRASGAWQRQLNNAGRYAAEEAARQIFGHKPTWEKSMGATNLRKAVAHKYIKRVAKPGGGFSYVYAEGQHDAHGQSPLHPEHHNKISGEASKVIGHQKRSDYDKHMREAAEHVASGQGAGVNAHKKVARKLGISPERAEELLDELEQMGIIDTSKTKGGKWSTKHAPHPDQKGGKAFHAKKAALAAAEKAEADKARVAHHAEKVAQAARDRADRRAADRRAEATAVDERRGKGAAAAAQLHAIERDKQANAAHRKRRDDKIARRDDKKTGQQGLFGDKAKKAQTVDAMEALAHLRKHERH